LQHFGQNIAKGNASSSCFFLIFMVSSWELRELRMSVLKLSNKFPISTQVTAPLEDLLILERISRDPLPCLLLPLEYCLHNSQMDYMEVEKHLQPPSNLRHPNTHLRYL
jgi:hypothetical protein